MLTTLCQSIRAGQLSHHISLASLRELQICTDQLAYATVTARPFSETQPDALLEASAFRPAAKQTLEQEQ